jgi:hypothetical protein
MEQYIHVDSKDAEIDSMQSITLAVYSHKRMKNPNSAKSGDQVPVTFVSLILDQA